MFNRRKISVPHIGKRKLQCAVRNVHDGENTSMQRQDASSIEWCTRYDEPNATEDAAAERKLNRVAYQQARATIAIIVVARHAILH